MNTLYLGDCVNVLRDNIPAENPVRDFICIEKEYPRKNQSPFRDEIEESCG
jgi:hypothetical protein